MSAGARRVWGDAAKSAFALLVLVIALVSIDDRVQEQVGAVLRAERASTFANAGAQIGDVASVILYSAWTQTVDRAPLMIFVVTAAVLVLWMLRT